MSVSISGDGSVTGIDQGLNVVGVVTATTLNVGTGASISSPATNVLTLGTNNSERVRITSSGLVGIGTDNPIRALHVSGTTDTPLQVETTQSNLYLNLKNSVASNGYVGFETSNITVWNGGAERLRITSAGAVQIANGNLVFSTAGTGIDFSAASGSAAGSQSALLDDYEEGTFTPTDGSGAGLTFTDPRGHYVKIGNLVNVQVRLTYPSQANGNAAVISGLPFIGYNPSDVSNGAVASGFGYIGGGSVIPQIHMSGSQALTYLYNFTSALTNGNLSGVQLRFGIVYRTS